MSRPALRRTDKAMTPHDIAALLATARVVNLATAGADGVPYVVPNLFIWEGGTMRVHTTSAQGHFARNLAANPRVCFAVHEAGEVFPYGEFDCDTSMAFRSVIGWGTVTIEDAEADKARFFDALMAKYGDPSWQRPPGFYPRLGEVTVFRIAVEELTGKSGPLPGPAERWPAVNATRSPGAVPPRR
ncbi:pyridoxamine 5'-phosphate oxidase family protein [Roseomonas sp. JC162]|uniref:Pyridoxamine 5'-phosphate oxidase family protein n=1 Tax=Neoroseomonas marina TaxID=1232220 RepID=A0A848E9J2_9PROT|nr:pyridoxamine 5'-phosphate oxidase family protein [Neoroseomonas marina]NMJ41124.1 pyridoxamine 5'-phosphate oxidase family protein [Neoroseomonas marina]